MNQDQHPTPRNYLFALTWGGGTVPPELGVAARLVARGHRVSVLGEDSMARDIVGIGAGFLAWAGNSAEQMRDWALRSPTALARDMIEHMITGPAAEQARAATAAIEELNPEHLVASFTAFGAMIAAEARGLSFDVLIPNTYPMPAPGMPQVGSGLTPARGPLGRLRERASAAGATALMNHYALAPINALRASYGLAPITGLWEQVHRARRELLLTSRDFDFPAVLPENARYVGPILDDPAWALDPGWAPPTGEGKLVLIAMSSTFQNQTGVLQRIADALGTLPVRGLLGTGPKIAPEDIRAPANVSVVAAVPHALALPHAALVMTHGGHGTVIKSLAAGVPLLILPHGRDQGDNAARVVARGAGLVLSRRAPAAKIADAVRTLLGSDSYRLAAERLGVGLRRDANDGSLLRELESI